MVFTNNEWLNVVACVLEMTIYFEKINYMVTIYIDCT